MSDVSFCLGIYACFDNLVRVIGADPTNQSNICIEGKCYNGNTISMKDSLCITDENGDKVCFDATELTFDVAWSSNGTVLWVDNTGYAVNGPI